MTPKVCIELTDKFPLAFSNILPESKRSPEVCLKVTLNDESLRNAVPEHIANSKEMNIYRFGILVTKQLPKLEFNQIRDLYKGRKIEISCIVSKNQPSERMSVQYNPQKKSLEYCNIPVSKKEKTILKPEMNSNHKIKR